MILSPEFLLESSLDLSLTHLFIYFSLNIADPTFLMFLELIVTECKIVHRVVV